MENKTKSGVVVFSPMKEEGGLEEVVFFREEENDLSYWEFINSPYSDADDVISLSDGSCHFSSTEDSPIADLILDSGDHDYEPYTEEEEEEEEEDQEVDEVDGHDLYQQCEQYRDGYVEPYPYAEEEDQEEGDGDRDDYDESDDDDDGYDLDDELVPRAFSGKYGRERMRKLGKRAFAKMNTSKKSPFLYIKPGCVHGKHGLGLKYRF